MPSLRNPEFWRMRADEARAIGDNTRHKEAKEIMERIARDYERLADMVEKEKTGPVKDRP